MIKAQAGRVTFSSYIIIMVMGVYLQDGAHRAPLMHTHGNGQCGTKTRNVEINGKTSWLLARVMYYY